MGHLVVQDVGPVSRRHRGVLPSEGGVQLCLFCLETRVTEVDTCGCCSAIDTVIFQRSCGVG